MTATEFSNLISDTIKDATETSWTSSTGSSAEKKRRSSQKRPECTRSPHITSLHGNVPRRAAQKKLTQRSVVRRKQQGRSGPRRYNAKNLEKKLGKVEKALRYDSATIDLGDLDALPDAVSDLVGESEVVFQPNDGPQTDFLRRVSETYSTAVLPVVVNLSLSWPILCASVTTLIIVGFFLGVLSTN